MFLLRIGAFVENMNEIYYYMLGFYGVKRALVLMFHIYYLPSALDIDGIVRFIYVRLSFSFCCQFFLLCVN